MSDITRRSDPATSTPAGGEHAMEPSRPASLLDGAQSSLGAAALQRKLARRAAQRKAGGDGALEGEGALQAAEHGVSGSGGALPHLESIQRSFGSHDVSGVRAHTDSPARAASERLGAEAYATGNDVAFAGAPSLHTAAHEAAHVVQQRAGVSLKAGVGEAGDAYEQHADRVADLVVQGRSAQPVLDEMAGAGATLQGGVQRQAAAVQRQDKTPPVTATEVSNKITDAPYAWQSKFDVKFTAAECVLVIRAKLVPQSGVSKEECAKVAERAKAAFKSMWDSKFVLTDVASKVAYTLRTEVQFVDAGEHYSINLFAGGDGSTSGNRTKWYVGFPDIDYAHELGHQLGLKDEYIDATAPDRKDASAPGVHADNSIMGDYYSEGKDKAEAKLRHGETIGSEIAGTTGVKFTVSKKK